MFTTHFSHFVLWFTFLFFVARGSTDHVHIIYALQKESLGFLCFPFKYSVKSSKALVSMRMCVSATKIGLGKFKVNSLNRDILSEFKKTANEIGSNTYRNINNTFTTTRCIVVRSRCHILAVPHTLSVIERIQIFQRASFILISETIWCYKFKNKKKISKIFLESHSQICNHILLIMITN